MDPVLSPALDKDQDPNACLDLDPDQDMRLDTDQAMDPNRVHGLVADLDTLSSRDRWSNVASLVR